MPGLEDINFRHTVILICEHSEEGAFGIILNRVLMKSFIPLMSAFDLSDSLVDMPIHFGGPVRPEQGYVIYSPFDTKYGPMKINRNIAVTASKEILHDIAAGRGPKQYFFALGFAGWTANQLEEELMMDSWLVAPLNIDIIFNLPAEKRWTQAAATIGVDLGRLVHRSGKA
ncbi:MAG: YqgE/AlgH family protein [Thermodesulfovibrionales bacterium]